MGGGEAGQFKLAEAVSGMTDLPRSGGSRNSHAVGSQSKARRKLKFV
jgi:hypothetical protein